jgi:hypothetical protein
MREFSPQRRKVIALSGALASTGGLIGAIGAVGKHHYSIVIAGLGAEVVLLVYLLCQFVVLKREESGVKLRLDE